jgi:hypothetical protein
MQRLCVGLVLGCMFATSSLAGGPVVVIEEDEVVVEEGPASSAGKLPLLLIPLFVCIVLCGGSDDAEPQG